MEIITEAEFEEIPVTDVVFGFAFGGSLEYTLLPGDEMKLGEKFIVITFKKNGAVAEVTRANLAFRTTLERIHKKPIKPQRPVIKEVEE